MQIPEPSHIRARSILQKPYSLTTTFTRSPISTAKTQQQIASTTILTNSAHRKIQILTPIKKESTKTSESSLIRIKDEPIDEEIDTESTTQKTTATTSQQIIVKREISPSLLGKRIFDVKIFY